VSGKLHNPVPGIKISGSIPLLINPSSALILSLLPTERASPVVPNGAKPEQPFSIKLFARSFYIKYKKNEISF
jgi:hypothetical protein